MKSLLDLPTELIFEIIDIVLFSPQPLPVPADVIRHRLGETASDNSTCYLASDTAHRPSAIPLLLTCQRLSSQTKLYLSKTPAAQDWKLDIAIVNGHWIFPTWRFIPTQSSPLIERVEVNLLPCRTEDDSGGEVWPSYPYPPGGCDVKLWQLLSRFLTVGALGKRWAGVNFPKALTRKEARYYLNLRVRTLVLKLEITHTNLNETIPLEVIPSRKIKDLAHLSFEKLYPIDSIISQGLIDVLHHSMESCLQERRTLVSSFFERIGRVEFCIDGSTKLELQLQDFIRVEERGQEFSTKDRVFEEEKTKIRQELGLE